MLIFVETCAMWCNVRIVVVIHCQWLMVDVCCADCGEAGGASLKVCKACMSVKYCNDACQMNHWLKHKKLCKLRAAELRDKALFKGPPAKDDCPICFLPMPIVWYAVCRFHLRLYHLYQLMNLRLQMWGWLKRCWKYIIHAVGRVFV